MSGPLPTPHVLGHIRDTLATDERVGELGLVVSAEPTDGVVGGEVVVVRGAVSTPGRKAGVVVVAREVLVAYGLEREVRDETDVPSHEGPGDEVEAL